MSSVHLAVTRVVFVALAVTALALVPLTHAVAQSTPDNPRDEGSPRAAHSYARANYIWPYSTGPQYPAIDIDQQGVIGTPAGVFQLRGELGIPVELRASGKKLDSLGAQYYAVAYSTELGVLESLRSVIEGGGGVYLGSPSDGALVAKLTPAALAALQTALGVLAIEPYHGAFKLEPSIGRTPLPNPIKALSDTYSLEVSLWRGEDPAAVAEAILAIGGSVSRTYPDSLEIELHRSLLPQLADIEAVRMVTENLPRMPLGQETTSIMQHWDGRTGWIGATPYHDAGVTGAGLGLCRGDLSTPCSFDTQAVDCNGIGDESCLAQQVLMVLDSGFQLDAGDLSDTRTSAGFAGTAHRKVRVHELTDQFGGTGDSQGCDNPPQGGFTHGHVVAAIALGNATNVDASYGVPWFATDPQGNEWELDGVAPGAVLVGYDGQVTPHNGACSDPLLDGIIPGDLYSGGSTGSLGESYEDHGARIANFSWGQQNNTYNQDAADIDQFLSDKKDSMVFISAGDAGGDIFPPGGDGVSDPETLGAPCTAKNGLCIGASRNVNTVNSPESRAFFSSVGPAVNTTVNRIAPQLMAPGDEPGGGSLGLASEFTCRSNDNNQTNPVQCDIISGLEGTSFASAAAAGAALLVRDYFAQGFHPDRRQNPADSIEIGGALVKAVLAVSADFMSGANLSRSHRWNNEQGYGRIQLDHALPLESWSESPTGLLIHDPFSSTTNLGLPFTVSTGQTHGTTFEVCNDEEELRVMLAWVDDPAGQAPLRNDLNLTLISPSGIEYRGNYFTDDDDQDGVPEGVDGCTAGMPGCEDCGGIGAEDVNVRNLMIDQSQWSLPVCDKTSVQGKSLTARDFDNSNPTEGIFLSHDPEGDDLPSGSDPGTGGDEGSCTPGSSANALGTCGNNLDCRTSPGAAGVCVNQDDYQQTELGLWTLEVKAGPGTIVGDQEFALAIAGGVCLGSVVKFDQGSYTCNERTIVTVTEMPEGPQDLNPSELDVESRTTVQVVDGNDVVVDTETGLNFTKQPNGLKFESDPLQLTDGTARDSGNGALDIRDGDTLRVVYQDVDPTTGLAGDLRTNSASIGCKVQIGFGSITFAQFGQDSSTLVLGGCERNVRAQFEFGFPDRYMDAGESLIFNFAFNSMDAQDLDSVIATLSCVNVDADSPAQCLPSGAGCEESGGTPAAPDCGGPCDPLRENNTPCDWMTILDPLLHLGFLPAGAAISANYAIEMAGDGAGEPFEDGGSGQPTPTVEMLLTVEAAVSGKAGSALAVSRQRLNRDSLTTWYSTDYPTGGSEVVDHGPGVAGNNNEIAEDPITELGNFQGNDYRFETFVFSDLTAGGSKNMNLLAPWSFDGTDGGFLVGLAAASDESAADIFNIANWGEDKNFNNIEDGSCFADPAAACYTYPLDVRCPAFDPSCVTTENNDPLNDFDQHWSSKGGCGWQTRATGECTGDDTRGCFADDDCLGTCHVIGNDIASGFEPCIDNAECPAAAQCSSLGPHPLLPCPNGDSDCGGGVGSCQSASQECQGEAGTCGPVVGEHTGGVWHTGEIGTPDLACTGGPGSACANYKVIADTDGQLLWWELLVTPVMEKVNTNVNPDGTREATIEIFDWAWNQQANLSDSNAAYSWEFDTDLATLAPVDLFADASVLNIAAGPYGAVNLGTNPALTRGWTVFAPQGVCATAPFGPCDGFDECSPGECSVSLNDCHVDADCAAGGCSGSGGPCFSDVDCELQESCSNPPPEGCSGAPVCDFTGLESVNGGPGNNSRVGQAGCFFEGNISPSGGFGDLGLAQPLDDDRDNDGDLTADEYVQDDGPYRNHDIVAFNGPDMRFETLEDSFGDTGDTFQAAIGFISFEGTPTNEATQSYGLAVDDMVVKWREFTLEEDVTDCDGSLSCAVIQLATTNVFEGQAVLAVTVLDSVPSGNDCDLDGTPEATFDCNGNGTPDVVVQATSEAELTGEILFLDQTAVASEYTGEIVVSILSDSPGVLYLAPQGADLPTVTVTYVDSDIDPGPAVEVCPNDVDPAKHGVLVDTTTVFLDGFCEVLLVEATVSSDNGDGDVFPDTEEIVEMQISLINNCQVDLSNCTARLFSDSPEVDCILDATIDVGNLEDTEDSVIVPDTFRWKVADLNRTDLDQTFEAVFHLTMSCDQIDALSTQQSFAVTLDLDLDDLGQTPTEWTESFESGSLGTFFPENLDAGLPGANNTEGLINGDGYRCQYSDPDRPNSNNYGNPASDDCFPGNNLASANFVYWAVDGIDTNSPDGGRSIDGNYSAYFGSYLTEPAGQFTTPVNVIESIALANPINLGVGAPELTFWHQVSVFDGRGLNMPDERNADRGVVQGKLLNAADQDITDWFNLEPYQNPYGTQAYDAYFNCFFDPIDDGSTEDDFFDPTDPNRRLGPSSTCFPGFQWSCQGETALPFAVGNVCNGTTEPAANSHDDALGTGTWVETKVNLSAFRGQRLKLRYIVTGLRLNANTTWEDAFPDLNPDVIDDGWWVDDIRVSESLETAAVLQVDDKNLMHCAGDTGVGCYTSQDCIDNGSTGPCVGDAPQCGPTCTTLSAEITTVPDDTGGPLDELLVAPGQPIILDASGSTGTCLDGALQYRFSTDGDATALREFSENPIYLDAPQVDADYVVEVRCSTDGPLYACSDPGVSPDAARTVDVDVDCPSSGATLLGDFETILAQGDKTTWVWATPASFELLQGDLGGVSTYSGASTTGAGTSFSDGTLPPSGAGTYYITRELGSFCNEFGSWGANECVLGDAAASWYPAPTCDRDQDIP